MLLKKLMDLLSRPRTGTQKLKALLLVIQATIATIHEIERNRGINTINEFTREFISLGNRIQNSLDHRKLTMLFDSQKELRAGYMAEIDDAHEDYMTDSRDLKTFCNLYQQKLRSMFLAAGFVEASAIKAFEESVIAAIQPMPMAGQANHRPNSFSSDVTGPIYGSDMDHVTTPHNNTSE